MNLIADFVALFSDFKKLFAKELIFGGIGTIDSFDKQKMRADVQPLLFQTSKGIKSNNAIIPQVPVQFLSSGGFYIRPDYKKGDLVWLGYATFAIENQLKGQYESTDGATNHGHALSVMNGVASSGWNPPAEFSKDGLLMGHQNSGLWLQVTDTKINAKGTEFNWDGDFNVTGKINANGEVTANANSEKVTLTQHTHKVNVNAGIHVSVAGSPSAQTGATDAPGTGSTQTANPGA